MFIFSSITKQEKGQGLVKYAIVLGLIAMVILGVMNMLNPRIGGTLSTINNSPDGVVNNEGVVIAGNFQADDLYWNNPANGCKKNYNYGTNTGCDEIVDRVRACLAGGTGPYCDDYFAVSPR
jgi:Flp pilus assembly pilin Flp